MSKENCSNKMQESVKLFREKYPEGKISVNVSQSNGCVMARARIYPKYNEEERCYLSEITIAKAIDDSIPVKDLKGRIQGLQIRRDNSEKRKFRWVSSVDLKDGCKAEGWTHLAGKVKNSIIITEGPMKADVIHALSGATVLAVPGVQSLTQLSNTLEQLKGQGLEKVYTAFDMDMLSNPHVQSGFENLGKLLSEMGIWYKTYVWPTEYKGLDDFIWEHQMNRK
ncbi:toprim domain-containing protein, partial [bacterium]|nr:toprim domain-containing protein [bacterium]